MKDKPRRHSMHLATCMAWVLVQILVSTTVFAQTFKDPETAIPTTDTSSPSPQLTPQLTPSSIPRRPQPGDKLGYSKEESTRLLDPELRHLLDALLRLYREPGLFTDRRAAMETLDVDEYSRTLNTTTQRSEGQPTPYIDRFASRGIFVRPELTGHYEFGGWRGPKKELWYSEVRIDVDHNKRCYDSQAIEGYLDVFLQTGLDGRSHPVSTNRWNRHGAYGSPSAIALGPTTPHLGMIFIGGCLENIGVYRAFDRKEVDDAKNRD